ncbi:MAG: RluA family pseudouridine synthase [Leptospiraceae bacterium]|nr:RluA family pseudouridine synthase [Leptospiraceae bacterium]
MDNAKQIVKEYTIKEEDEKVYLVDFLTNRFTYYPKENWEELIQQKRITLSGSDTHPNYQLKKGDKIVFKFPELLEPEVDSNFEIVYEDEFIFAVNKSGNLPVHPAGRYQTQNLTTLLGQSIQGMQNSQKPIFFIVNRIDRETSGIVLFAKDKTMAALLSKLFSSHQIDKTYIVYVEGSFPSQLTAEGFITKDDFSKIRKKKRFMEQIIPGKECTYVKTEFIKIGEKNHISKIFAFPITGKIHQIRATLSSKGYPVLGDKIYGKDENIFLEFIQYGNAILQGELLRQALHSYSLKFIHPITKKVIEIIAPEPHDLKKIYR